MFHLKHKSPYFSNDIEVPEIPWSEIEVNQEIWVDKNNQEHKIKNMSNKHIQNCINLIEKSKENSEAFEEYLEIFKKELQYRNENNIHIEKRNNSLIFKDNKHVGRKLTKAFKNLKEEDWDLMPSSVKMLCACDKEYQARKADLKRGWGLSCSKSCSAKRKLNLQQPAKII